jgi:hypothetical protein
MDFLLLSEDDRTRRFSGKSLKQNLRVGVNRLKGTTEQLTAKVVSVPKRPTKLKRV